MNLIDTTHRGIFVPLHKWLSEIILSRMDTLIILSTSEEAKARAILPKKDIRYVRGPYFVLPKVSQRYHVASAKSLLETRNHTLLFFGFVRPYKGLHILLEAFPKVLKKFPDSKLIIAGKFWTEGEKIKSQIRSSTFSKKVLIYDEFIPEEGMSLYFNASDLLIIPYLSATQSAVIPISLSYGLPVIATNVGGNKDWIKTGENGILIKPNNPNALSNAIINAFSKNQIDFFRENIKKMEKPNWKKSEKIMLG